MEKRDNGDKSRDIGQLTIVEDAIVFDNSNYDLSTTVEKLFKTFVEYGEKS